MRCPEKINEKKKPSFFLHIRTRTQQSRGRFIQKQEEKEKSNTKQKKIRRKNNKYIYLILLNKYKIYTNISHLAKLNKQKTIKSFFRKILLTDCCLNEVNNLVEYAL